MEFFYGVLAALFFCTYESCKSLLGQHTSIEHAPFVHMASASIGEMVTNITFS